MFTQQEHTLHCAILLLSVAAGQLTSSNDHGPTRQPFENDLYGCVSTEEIRSNIASLYTARTRAENTFKGDPIAKLAEEISENSRDCSCFYRKQDSDMIYENHTDFARELVFAPGDYNCGKQFDIAKLLNLVKKYSKLKPYTIGSDTPDNNAPESNNANQPKESHSIETQYRDNSEISASTVMIAKDALHSVHNGSTPPTANKGSWWFNQQKVYPQETKAKIPVKGSKNVTNMTPNLNEIKSTKLQLDPMASGYHKAPLEAHYQATLMPTNRLLAPSNNPKYQNPNISTKIQPTVEIPGKFNPLHNIHKIFSQNEQGVEEIHKPLPKIQKHIPDSTIQKNDFLTNNAPVKKHKSEENYIQQKLVKPPVKYSAERVSHSRI